MLQMYVHSNSGNNQKAVNFIFLAVKCKIGKVKLLKSHRRLSVSNEKIPLILLANCLFLYVLIYIMLSNYECWADRLLH